MLMELCVYLLICAAVLSHPVLCGGGYPYDHTMVRYPGPVSVLFVDMYDLSSMFFSFLSAMRSR